MRFPAFLLASLVVVGGIAWILISGQQGRLANLEGSILKIRTYPLNPNASLIFADFRVTNPGQAAFIVNKVEMVLYPATGEPISAGVLTREETDRVFAYTKIAGPKYNDPLIIANRVEPSETIDRMSAGRVELSEADIEKRLSVRIRVHEMSGRVSEIAEVVNRQ
jgi:hypothetical protein